MNFQTFFSLQIVALMGSLTTCDPGDIHNTIQVCKSANVRCSVISLAAEVHVYKKLAKETDGVFSVILDDVHLRDLLQVRIQKFQKNLKFRQKFKKTS